MKTTNQPDQRPADHTTQLLIRGRNLAAYIGALNNQRPEPISVGNKVQWIVSTAMSVRQIRIAYQESGALFKTMELYIDMGDDIKKSRMRK